MILQEQLSNGLIKLKAAYGYIHKKGTDNYAKATIMLSGETLDMYEIVDKKPEYTKAECDVKVNELVRMRYSESEEFAIQRKMLNAMLPQPAALSDDENAEPIDAEKAITEYTEYNAYVEKCKLDAPQAVLEDIEMRKQIEAEEQAKADSLPDNKPVIDIKPIEDITPTDYIVNTTEDERLTEELMLNIEKRKAEQAKAYEARQKEQERLEAERLEVELEAKHKEAEQRAEAERLKAQLEAEKRAEINRGLEESEKFRREYIESLKNK